MKKLRSYVIVLISLLVLLGSCFTAAATSIDDGTSDVWHWTFTFTGGRWDGNIGNKPNIDIKEISYSVNDNKITLKMEVSGEIQNSEKVSYYMYYNSSDTHYVLSYNNGNGSGVGLKGMDVTEEDVTVSGDTLSVVLDVLGDTSKVDLWGYAAEYFSYGDLSAEWWGDWAPNEKFPFDTGTDGTDGTDGTNGTDGTDGTDGGLDDKESGSDKKTPGFELVLILAAVAVVFIVLRKRR